jgi:hypothetical protein
MSAWRIVVEIAKLVAALVLALILFVAVLFSTDTECESDCSWVADVFFSGNGAYFLFAICFALAVGLVWGIPAARRKRRTIRTHDS